VPPASIRKAERSATSRIPFQSEATPNARTASPFQSDSSATSRSSACDQAMWQ
jgi:hypothetical protein